MAKALIIFSSRTGQTKIISEFIREGLVMSGVEVNVVSFDEIKNETHFRGYNALAFGSSTHFGDMLQGMKNILLMAKKVKPEGLVGGSFGTYEFSGNAPDQIFFTMKNTLKMDMVSGPLSLKSISSGREIKMARKYGQELARKLGKKE